MLKSIPTDKLLNYIFKKPDAVQVIYAFEVGMQTIIEKKVKNQKLKSNKI